MYYQVDYSLEEVPEDAAYFHAQFRRVNPLPYKEVYTILDGVEGSGHYVGTYMAWGVNSKGWWGEGEIKFFIDDDTDYPTICGTGTEDYFCGSYDFSDPVTHDHYVTFSTPYTGLAQVIQPDGHYASQTRFGLYRFHLTDPVRFEKQLKVTIQALGWREGGRYLPLQDDIASVAFWYQTPPFGRVPRALPDRDALRDHLKDMGLQADSTRRGAHFVPITGFQRDNVGAWGRIPFAYVRMTKSASRTEPDAGVTNSYRFAREREGKARRRSPVSPAFSHAKLARRAG